MVQLILISPKGNQGNRYFPYTGYLGLTPLRIEGIVRTRIDHDGKLLPAKSLTVSVRCYESRLGRVSVLRSNVLVDYTQVLWSKPDSQEYADLGEVEYPFKITIPAKAAGFSTTTFVDYRCLWRVEAIIHHIPIAGVGSRQIKHFELPLIRYDLPPHPQPPPSPSPPSLDRQTDKPRAPKIRYCIETPTTPIGPMDLVSIPLHLLPLDPSVSVRSASVVIERRIQLNESTSPPSPLLPTYPQQTTPLGRSSPSSALPHNTPVIASTSMSMPSHSYSPTASYQDTDNSVPHLLIPSTSTPSPISASVSSLSTEGEARPLLTQSSIVPPPPLSTASSEALPSKLVTTPIAGAESSGVFSRDNSGVWNKTLTLQWPAAKSNSRWAIGETIQSEFVAVKFMVHVKVAVSTPSGTESIELAEQELLVVSTNEAERQLAVSRYNELLESAMEQNTRSKSKSPRGRVRRERDNDIPPIPQATPFTGSSNSSRPDTGQILSTASVQVASSLGKAKPSPRRPHTSAGPRDRVLGFASSFGYNRMKENHGQDDREPDVPSHRRRFALDSSRARPDTASTDIVRSPTKYLFTPRMSISSSGSRETERSSRGTSIMSSNSSGLATPSTGTSEDVRAWEEELARIELQSRRSSDLLGFAYKRKRTTDPSQPYPT